LRCGDWLLFLCPGKRELPGDHLDILEPPPSGSLAEIFRSTLRQADISFKHLELCPLEIKPKEAFCRHICTKISYLENFEFKVCENIRKYL
jgi:hypothetical protein